MTKTDFFSKDKFYNNNFFFLRFFAACLVILYHSVLLSKSTSIIFSYIDASLFGSLALQIFFFISGFLITKSWIDSPNFFIFIKKRILRIFPGIIFVTLFCAFIIGPIATNRNLYQYFGDILTWKFLENILLVTNTTLPGVFANNPYPSVNGSVWSLPYEFLMYLSIPLFWFLGVIKPKRHFILFVPLIMIIVPKILNLTGLHDLNLLSISVWKLTNLGTYFIIGSIYYLYRDKLNLDPRLALIAFFLFFLPLKFSSLWFLNLFTLTYLVIYFSFAIKSNFLRNFGKFGDFSYGMYIFAWPIQQSIISVFGPGLNFLLFLIFTYFLTFILAVISWNTVEKQALKFKK